MIKQIKTLDGHSGCYVILCKNGERTFVRKVSSSTDYNIRLREQARKQANFMSNIVNTPNITGSGITDDGLFYFDMDYICGVSLAEYMRSIEIGKIRNIVVRLVQHITEIDRQNGSARTDKIVGKIKSLRRSLAASNNNTSGRDMQLIFKALEVLESHSWDKFIESSCHGDLTFENIIVYDGELYLIDFLDSFYDCWILDISTLLQDAYTMWAYRNWNTIDNNTQIRLAVFRDILMDEINSIDGGIWISETFYALLLKLLRIYPYTCDEKTVQFLNSKVELVLSILEKGDFTL